MVINVGKRLVSDVMCAASINTVCCMYWLSICVIMNSVKIPFTLAARFLRCKVFNGDQFS